MVSYVSQNFIGVASDDVAYNGLPAERKQRAEFQFLKNALADGGRQLHQGVYAVTSSGKFLGKSDGGWPIYDAALSLNNLKKVKADYSKLSRRQRVAKRSMIESDRSLVIEKASASKGYLKLVNRARHYDFPEMEKFDARHPIYAKRDSLWLSESEAQGLLPDTFELGVQKAVANKATDKLLLHGHLAMSCPAWWREHIKKREMHVRVDRVETGKVYLSYEGDFTMLADSQWNKSGYKGTLLGKACWNKHSKKFESLEWVALGERGLQELKSNLHRGNTKNTHVAAYLRLANDSITEQELKPHKWGEYRK